MKIEDLTDDVDNDHLYLTAHKIGERRSRSLVWDAHDIEAACKLRCCKKEDPEAVVIKYNDGGTTATSSIEALSRVPIKLPQGMQDQAVILIE